MISSNNRIIAIRDYLTAALSICRNTAFGDVQEIGKFLSDCAVYGEPVAVDGRSGIRDLGWHNTPSMGRRPIPLQLFPVYEEDRKLSEVWATHVDFRAYGCYMDANHAIMLRPELQESGFVRGCILLHEAGHALQAVREGRNHRTNKARADAYVFLEEYEMHDMEMRLWRERGDQQFQAILDQLVEWLVLHHEQEQIAVGQAVFHIPFPELGIGDALNSFLGPLPPGASEDARFSNLRIFSHFELTDRSDIQDKRLQKAGIIATIHDEVKVKQTL